MADTLYMGCAGGGVARPNTGRTARQGQARSAAVSLALLAGATFCLAACTLIGNPAAREVHEYVRPDGQEVRCYGPPPESYPTGFHIALGAHIPELVELADLFQANFAVEKLHTRLREVAPNLLAAEAIEFRLCAAWAQGLIDEETYRYYLGEVMPELWEACGAGECEVENLPP